MNKFLKKFFEKIVSLKAKITMKKIKGDKQRKRKGDEEATKHVKESLESHLLENIDNNNSNLE